MFKAQNMCKTCPHTSQNFPDDSVFTSQSCTNKSSTDQLLHQVFLFILRCRKCLILQMEMLLKACVY